MDNLYIGNQTINTIQISKAQTKIYITLYTICTKSKLSTDAKSCPFYKLVVTLQITAESFKLAYQMQHILLRQARILKYYPEEVGQVVLSLVSDHHAALFHHPLLDCGRNSVQPFVVIGLVFGIPQTGRDVPEANVGELRLFQYHFEAQAVLDTLGEEMGVVHYFVHVVLEARRAFGFPHVPEL